MNERDTVSTSFTDPADKDGTTPHRRRPVTGASDEDPFDVAYRTVDSPVGPLLLAATQRGLVRVAFEVEDFDRVLGTLAARVGPRVLAAPAPLDAAARQVEEYFTRRRTSFDLGIDLRLTSGFRREVLTRLAEVPYGTTVGYAALATAAGSPRAVRATGTACATNPLPVVLPCHRVVRSDGGIGGYIGGVDAKRVLLDLEAA
ncbi:methylated-DNA--[protein]-cysteine S-methyltransferase [Marinactinospora thermotolerans]|uniref:Methylated-DNA--protein-cysteine methyltransferase n=1 Tax=Marinactinospora thermotolerans DSM 45154 TaxID=1122192 RepID=A0A1T4R627_9ACTN|nr:methylated-DNA--[protein]-cysteine S-methyltransferase [Marinactinospora thermotolerans]SKA11128.1 methylated-DNA-[protein]-cysteine S-methyltransferase [Marinactinospora thermotolerans DSM 45154]